MNSSQCSLDPNRREVRVTALTDDKALLIVSCEAGPITRSIWRGWCHVKPFSARSVRLRLPFTPSGDSSEIELMNASFDEKTRELTTLSLGRGMGIVGSRRAGGLTASVSARCAMPRNPAVITGMGQTPAHAVDHAVAFAGWRCRLPGLRFGGFVGRVRRSRHPATQTALNHAQRLSTTFSTVKPKYGNSLSAGADSP